MVGQARQKEAEVREELEFHLAEEFEQRKAAGLTDEQARFAARRDLGNLPLVLEDTRAVWGWSMLDQARQDLRYAVRTLSRTPSVTLAAAITLAFGIGLTTAIFSVVYGILLRPLPLNDPERLFVLHTIRQTGDLYDNALSAPNFMSLNEEESQTFARLAGAVDTDRTLTGVGEARRVDGVRVSAGFFEVLATEIRATDPVTFAGVALTLGATALLASVVPAWRASTVDPLVALRAD